MRNDLELVRDLEPEIDAPSQAMMSQQRARLTAMIETELAGPVRIRPRRRRRTALRVMAVAAALSAIGGGTAFAWSRIAPDPRQAATIERQYAGARSGHGPGWRPELDAERVVCDYEGLSLQPPLIYTFASEFPLAESLTEQRIVDECRSGTDAVRTSPVRAAAVFCAVTPPGEHFAVPAVAFGNKTCREAGLAPPPAGLLDERNRLRSAEIAIRAVGDCPTASESLQWVRAQLEQFGEQLRIIGPEEHEGGRCYLPEVAWGRSEVRITAITEVPVDNGSPTTTPPSTPSP